MLGLMQDWPLLCHRIIEHAATIHGSQEVVTRSVEGPIVRTTYGEIHKRALKVSQQLTRHGIKLGDRYLQIGCTDASLLAAIASKVGLSGRACAIFP